IYRPPAVVDFIGCIAVDEHADGVGIAILPIAVRHLLPIRANPAQVLGTALERRFAAKEVPPTQNRVGMPDVEALAGEREEVPLSIVEIAFHPRDLVVLGV